MYKKKIYIGCLMAFLAAFSISCSKVKEAEKKQDEKTYNDKPRYDKKEYEGDKNAYNEAYKKINSPTFMSLSVDEQISSYQEFIRIAQIVDRKYSNEFYLVEDGKTTAVGKVEWIGGDINSTIKQAQQNIEVLNRIKANLQLNYYVVTCKLDKDKNWTYQVEGLDTLKDSKSRVLNLDKTKSACVQIAADPSANDVKSVTITSNDASSDNDSEVVLKDETTCAYETGVKVNKYSKKLTISDKSTTVAHKTTGMVLDFYYGTLDAAAKDTHNKDLCKKTFQELIK